MKTSREASEASKSNPDAFVETVFFPTASACYGFVVGLIVALVIVALVVPLEGCDKKSQQLADRADPPLDSRSQSRGRTLPQQPANTLSLEEPRADDVDWTNEKALYEDRRQKWEQQQQGSGSDIPSQNDSLIEQTFSKPVPPAPATLAQQEPPQCSPAPPPLTSSANQDHLLRERVRALQQENERLFRQMDAARGRVDEWSDKASLLGAQVDKLKGWNEQLRDQVFESRMEKQPGEGGAETPPPHEPLFTEWPNNICHRSYELFDNPRPKSPKQCESACMAEPHHCVYGFSFGSYGCRVGFRKEDDVDCGWNNTHGFRPGKVYGNTYFAPTPTLRQRVKELDEVHNQMELCQRKLSRCMAEPPGLAEAMEKAEACIATKTRGLQVLPQYQHYILENVTSCPLINMGHWNHPQRVTWDRIDEWGAEGYVGHDCQWFWDCENCIDYRRHDAAEVLRNKRIMVLGSSTDRRLAAAFYYFLSGRQLQDPRFEPFHGKIDCDVKQNKETYFCINPTIMNHTTAFVHHTREYTGNVTIASRWTPRVHQLMTTLFPPDLDSRAFDDLANWDYIIVSLGVHWITIECMDRMLPMNFTERNDAIAEMFEKMAPYRDKVIVRLQGAIGRFPSGRRCGTNDLMRRWNNMLVKHAVENGFTIWDNFWFTLNATEPEDHGRHACTPPDDNQYIHFTEGTRIQFVQQFLNYVANGPGLCRDVKLRDLHFPVEKIIPGKIV